MRLEELQTPSRRKARHKLEDLVERLTRVPAGLTWLPSKAPAGPAAGRPAAVRFVLVSDTHGDHEALQMPAGEVLLYAGDAVGNYGRLNNRELRSDFEDFLKWLWAQSRRFAQVFFISGNHETFLDDEQGDVTRGMSKLNAFLSAATNCTYLADAPAKYRGLRLFGSPTNKSRKETEGKRYYSCAFERTKAQRAALWAGIPEGLDVLMTHVPPSGHLCRTTTGDSLLSDRLAGMVSPPRFHVFGHDHDYLGVEKGERTTFLNAAQDDCLRADPRGGGCPLIFDIEARDGYGQT